MSARAARRAVERDRLDLLAAEAHADSVAADLKAWERAHVRADFLAGVVFERDRVRIHWRRAAPEWLQVVALTVVAALAVAAFYLMLLALAWAF